jgi:hypothetical protein
MPSIDGIESEKMLPDHSLGWFEALFSLVNARFGKQVAKGDKPFEG